MMAHPCGVQKWLPPTILTILLSMTDLLSVLGGQNFMILRSLTWWPRHGLLGNPGGVPSCWLVVLRLAAFLRLLALVAIARSFLLVRRPKKGQQRHLIDQLLFTLCVHLVLSIVMLAVYVTLTYGPSRYGPHAGPLVAFFSLSLEVLLLCLAAVYYEDYRYHDDDTITVTDVEVDLDNKGTTVLNSCNACHCAKQATVASV